MTEIWKNQEQEWAVLEHYRQIYASLRCKLKDIQITDVSVCSALEECLPGVKADDFLRDIPNLREGVAEGFEVFDQYQKSHWYESDDFLGYMVAQLPSEKQYSFLGMLSGMVSGEDQNSDKMSLEELLRTNRSKMETEKSRTGQQVALAALEQIRDYGLLDSSDTDTSDEDQAFLSAVAMYVAKRTESNAHVKEIAENDMETKLIGIQAGIFHANGGILRKALLGYVLPITTSAVASVASVAAVYTCYKLFEASLETIVATEGLSAVMIAASGILSGLLYGVLAISALAISAMVICAAIDMHEDAFIEVEMGSGVDNTCADFETETWDAEAEDDEYEEDTYENEVYY